MEHVAEVLRAVEGVDMEPVADLAGHLGHVRIDGRYVDGDARVLDGARVEEGRHEVEAVGLASEVERRAVLPACPDRAERQHHLAQPRPRRLPLEREAPLVVRLDLGAEAEHESAARGLLEVPGRVGEDHRASREGDGDGRAQLHAGGIGARDRQRQEGIVLGLGRPERAHAQRLGAPRIGGDVAEIERHEAEIELHGHRGPRRRLSTCGSRTRSPSP